MSFSPIPDGWSSPTSPRKDDPPSSEPRFIQHLLHASRLQQQQQLMEEQQQRSPPPPPPQHVMQQQLPYDWQLQKQQPQQAPPSPSSHPHHATDHDTLLPLIVLFLPDVSIQALARPSLSLLKSLVLAAMDQTGYMEGAIDRSLLLSSSNDERLMSDVRRYVGLAGASVVSSSVLQHTDQFRHLLRTICEQAVDPKLHMPSLLARFESGEQPQAMQLSLDERNMLIANGETFDNAHPELPANNTARSPRMMHNITPLAINTQSPFTLPSTSSFSSNNSTHSMFPFPTPNASPNIGNIPITSPLPVSTPLPLPSSTSVSNPRVQSSAPSAQSQPLPVSSPLPQASSVPVPLPLSSLPPYVLSTMTALLSVVEASELPFSHERLLQLDFYIIHAIVKLLSEKTGFLAGLYPQAWYSSPSAIPASHRIRFCQQLLDFMQLCLAEAPHITAWELMHNRKNHVANIFMQQIIYTAIDPQIDLDKLLRQYWEQQKKKDEHAKEDADHDGDGSGDSSRDSSLLSMSSRNSHPFNNNSHPSTSRSSPHSLTRHAWQDASSSSNAAPAAQFKPPHIFVQSSHQHDNSSDSRQQSTPTSDSHNSDRELFLQSELEREVRQNENDQKSDAAPSSSSTESSSSSSHPLHASSDVFLGGRRAPAAASGAVAQAPLAPATLNPFARKLSHSSFARSSSTSHTPPSPSVSQNPFKKSPAAPPTLKQQHNDAPLSPNNVDVSSTSSPPITDTSKLNPFARRVQAPKRLTTAASSTVLFSPSSAAANPLTSAPMSTTSTTVNPFGFGINTAPPTTTDAASSNNPFGFGPSTTSSPAVPQRTVQAPAAASPNPFKRAPSLAKSSSSSSNNPFGVGPTLPSNAPPFTRMPTRHGSLPALLPSATNDPTAKGDQQMVPLDKKMSALMSSASTDSISKNVKIALAASKTPFTARPLILPKNYSLQYTMSFMLGVACLLTVVFWALFPPPKSGK